jgi:itaconate CoA-transferase
MQFSDNSAFADLYASKLCSLDDAVRHLPKDTELITFGCYAGAPPGLARALGNLSAEGFFSTLPKAYLFRAADAIVDGFLRADILQNLQLLCPFMGGRFGALVAGAKELAKQHPDLKVPAFVPGHFSQYGNAVVDQYGIPDAHLFQVSPMDEHGYFSFGLDGSLSIPMAKKAKLVIAEVNPNMPRTFGAGQIHISQIDHLVEHASDLLVLPNRQASKTDQMIAEHLAPLVPDNACIQLGIGGVPNAVGALLHDKSDLGIHTELMCDALMDLVRAGNVTNRYKQIDMGHTIFNIVMFSDPSHYQRMHNNPTMHCHPASYVNDPHIIAQNDRMVSVNSFVEIDLFGQVASESIDWRQVSGTGGQVDFLRGASRSKDGLAVLAAHSTAKSGTVSKIVPRLNNLVTTPRTEVHNVATEHGIVNLFGLSNKARAEALIGLAAPQFRNELRFEAKRLNIL